jgi:pimeloyl-ACP methyl ester carboxylesterase
MPLPTVLMLPGTLCDDRIFSVQRRHLRGHAHLVCATYQGLKNPSAWLQALLHRMPDQFYVAGFSLGGLLALELLRIAGNRVQGLALIASNAQAASEKSKRKSAWLRRMWLDRGPSEVARHVKPAYFHHEAKRRKHERLVFDMALQTPRRSAFEEFAWAAQRPSGLQTLSEYKGKLLAVSGSQDRLCPPAWQRAMQAAQPRMQWIEFARCGHFVPLEAPAKLSRALRAWIAEPNRPLTGIERAQNAIKSGVFK